jgi:uncharacterized heparinase superfamily protein
VVPLSVRTTAEGEEVVSPPLQEAQAAYKTAKKLRRGAEAIRRLLDDAREQVRPLSDITRAHQDATARLRTSASFEVQRCHKMPCATMNVVRCGLWVLGLVY